MRLKFFGAAALVVALISLIGFWLLGLLPYSFIGDRRVTLSDLQLVGDSSYEQLKAEGFLARSDVPRIQLPLPIDWNMDPLEDRNWQFQLSAWRHLDPILNKFGETEDPIYLREALEIVLDWQKFQELHEPTPMTWYDMATGLRALKLAFLVQQVELGQLPVSDAEQAALLQVAVSHVNKLKEPKFIKANNHGVPQVFGLNLLCEVLSDNDVCADARDIAVKGFSAIMARGYTEEAVHKEHSPGYHLFVSNMIANFKPERLGKNAADKMEKALALTPWMTMPDRRMAHVGDTDDPGQLFTQADNLVSMPDGSKYAIGDFTRSGYAVIRSDPSVPTSGQSMLFVTGMAYHLTHKHADDLSFILWENGQLIFSEGGKYGYNHDAFRDYVLTAAAHNTISLADRAIVPRDVEMVGSQLSRLDVKDDHFLIEGRVNRPNLFIQDRSIRYAPGRWIEIEDRLESDSDRQFVSSLHLAPNLEPVIVDGGFEAKLPDGSLLTGTLADTDCEIEIVRGQRDPVLGWQTAGYLKMEPAAVVRAICNGRSRSITWRIEFN